MTFKYFELEEFACPCCGENQIDPLFVAVLDRIRDSAATPMVVTSGCRCEEHNEKVGGSPTSSHVMKPGELVAAADISATDSHTRFLILRAAFEHGVTRIGIAKDFIHLDGDSTKPDRLTWLY